MYLNMNKIYFLKKGKEKKGGNTIVCTIRKKLHDCCFYRLILFLTLSKTFERIKTPQKELYKIYFNIYYYTFPPFYYK